MQNYIFLAAKASTITVHPVNNMSIPNSEPMTHNPDVGHCSQIISPNSTAKIPFTANQPLCGTFFVYAKRFSLFLIL